MARYRIIATGEIVKGILCTYEVRDIVESLLAFFEIQWSFEERVWDFLLFTTPPHWAAPGEVEIYFGPLPGEIEDQKQEIEDQKRKEVEDFLESTHSARTTNQSGNAYGRDRRKHGDGCRRGRRARARATKATTPKGAKGQRNHE